MRFCLTALHLLNPYFSHCKLSDQRKKRRNSQQCLRSVKEISSINKVSMNIYKQFPTCCFNNPLRQRGWGNADYIKLMQKSCKSKAAVKLSGSMICNIALLLQLTTITEVRRKHTRAVRESHNLHLLERRKEEHILRFPFFFYLTVVSRRTYASLLNMKTTLVL